MAMANPRWIKKLLSAASACAVSLFLLCGFDGGCSFFNCPSGTNCSGGGYTTVQSFQTRNTSVLALNGQVISSIPRPYQPIIGKWSYDDNGPIGTVEEFGIPSNNKYTLFTGQTGGISVENLRQNANWNVGINYIGGCYTNAEKVKQLPTPDVYFDSLYIVYLQTTINFDCVTYVGSDFSATTPQFTLNTSLPSSLNVATVVPLSFTYGAPELLVYSRTGSVVATENAASVDPTGMIATFPYPVSPTGALPPDMYGTAILNTNSDGTQSYSGGGSFFSIGNNNTSYSDAFGVAAAEYTKSVTTCIPRPLPLRGTSCSTSTVQNHYPVVTLTDSSAVSWNGTTISVGSNPVAVDTYGTLSSSTSSNSGTSMITTDESGTGYAIVVNSGSNSVSLLNLINPGELSTLSVGTNPVAVSLSSDQSLAYVVNYGSGSITVISLVNPSVIGNYPVGTNPDSISVDASGNIWVGGNGYIDEISPSTYQVIQSITVSGNVTSLAVSSTQGKLVATVVPFSNTGTLEEQLFSTSGGQPTYSSSIGSTSAYLSSPVSGHLFTPVQLGTGTLVSANYGNDIAVVASPSGFVVTEVSTGETIMTGTTPYPIRSIAVDPNYGEVYLTVPDSNAVITVPLPPVPAS